ncbi:MAG TPA: hypothetical protein VHE35_25360 [Kofleriaceae bacterium]|nr:hypothetical protein [Kofleriaceae bacterium]
MSASALALGPAAAHANVRASVQPDGAIVFDQELPSGKAVTIELPAAGTDEAGGTVEVWPYDGTCSAFPEGAHQARRLGLGTTGTGNDRLLVATLSPLQIQTRYCIVFRVVRGLPDDKVDALAQSVGDVAAMHFDWATQCAEPDIEAKVAGFVADELTRRLATLQVSPGSTRTVDAAQVGDAATLITALADVRSLCRRVLDNDDALHGAHEAQKAANQALTLAYAQLKSVVAAPAQVTAWPPAVTEAAAPFTAVPMVEALRLEAAALTRLASRIAPADDALAADLRSLTTLSGTALADAIKPLQSRYEKAPPAPRDLMLFLPGRGAYVRASSLATEPGAYTAFLEDVGASQDLLQAQLRVLAAHAPHDAALLAGWKLAIGGVYQASRDVGAADAELTRLEGLRDDLATTLRASMVDAVKKDSVRRLLAMTTRSTASLPTARPADTDEKASWISLSAGAMVALPIIHDDGHAGVVAPWLVPYAGASIYFHRVDRVIDVGDLVGHTFWQRNSFTVGVWLDKPKLDGNAIAGIWSTGQVPFLGFGHRFTQYLRVDGGAAFFDYTRRLPIVTDKGTGVAAWLGVSLDADVWGLAKSKLQ